LGCGGREFEPRHSDQFLSDFSIFYCNRLFFQNEY
jgi:hypothetical protein